MGNGRKATASAQIRDEIRKLNLIDKSEIRRLFDEEGPIDLLRPGLTEDLRGDGSAPWTQDRSHFFNKQAKAVAAGGLVCRKRLRRRSNTPGPKVGFR